MLFFSSQTCVPCKTFEPIAERVARNLRLEYEKIMVNGQPNMANEYYVRSVPTIILVDNVGTRYQYTGPQTESALKSFITNIGGENE
jgi:thioredoxin 1